MTQVLPHLKRIGVLAVVTALSTRPASHAVEAAAQREVIAELAPR
jgi:hypothetical protein